MTLSELIRNRRSVFPKSYIPGKMIDRALIEELLEHARWAPTHKMTQPWRFKIFHSAESRASLSAYLQQYYRDNTPESQFSELALEKAGFNPLAAGAVIAICLAYTPEANLPEFEEIAAVSMAVQNMWLTCTEWNLGCYWSSPKAALSAASFLNLEPHERCLGLFYLGWHESPEVPRTRKPLEYFAEWR
ncbi:MAG: nitroreductase [Bacteroidetes bacterium]|nr:nitroreductase [Bacteroidota bacterium]